MTKTESATLAKQAEMQGLWWVWADTYLEIPGDFHGILARRRAVVEASANPLVQEAHSAILSGDEGLTRAILDRPEVAALLNGAWGYGGPSAAENWQRRGATSPAAELLEQATGKKAVMVMPDLEPGRGEWPKKPAHRGHQQETGTVITLQPYETQFTTLITPNWRDTEEHAACPACQYKRTQRQAKQVLFELARVGGLWLIEFDDDSDFGRFVARMRQERHRHPESDPVYRAYPLPAGGYIVIHNRELEGGHAIPDDRTALFNLLSYPANATPDGKRISSSVGWGGPWQGTKGDGRKKYAAQQDETSDDDEQGDTVQLWTTSPIADVGAALGVEIEDKRKTYQVTMRRLEAYQKLAAAGIVMHERTTNGGALAAILKAEGIDVTDKGHGSNTQEDMSVMRDNQTTAEPPGGALGEPRPLAFGIIGGAR